MSTTATSAGLADAVRRGVVVADGGLSTWLAAQGHDVSGPLWSARLLTEAPDAVRAGHAAFARAGARVLTTATYQASPGGFGLDVDGPAYARLVARAVRLAREAAPEAAQADAPAPADERAHADEPAYADQPGEGGESAPVGEVVPSPSGPAWVAASLGPWGAVLADGSEYTGAYAARLAGEARAGATAARTAAIDVAALRRAHRRRLAALAEAGPDAIACETLPCLAEVEALVAELSELDVPAWLSLTAVLGPGGRPTTRLGEPLAEAFALAASLPGLIAAGVNCCDPDVVAPAAALARVAGVPFVAMPNLGPWDARTRSWTPSPTWAQDLLDAVGPTDGSHGAGALVGGCCGVHPEPVGALAAGAAGRVAGSTAGTAPGRAAGGPADGTAGTASGRAAGHDAGRGAERVPGTVEALGSDRRRP